MKKANVLSSRKQLELILLVLALYVLLVLLLISLLF